jgi:hypothetical protein
MNIRLGNTAGAALLAAVLPLLSISATTHAVGPTQEARSTDVSLEKVGEGRLRVMFWSIYDARLYTPSGDYRDGSRPLRLEIEYLRDIKAKALVKQTKKEWAAMGRDHPRQDEWLSRLSTLWPDVRENDVLAIELTPDKEAVFTHNGDTLGRIKDPAFGQQFVDIWLSEDCTRPELRASLIGSQSGN